MRIIRREEPNTSSWTDEWGSKELGTVQKSTYGGGYTDYHVPKDAYRSSAHVTVYQPSSYSAIRIMPQGDEEHFKGWESSNTDDKGNIPMLTVDEYHPDPMITSLRSTRGGRAGAMTMLGVAEMDANRYGKSLTSDLDNANLSPHSSRLVEKLTGKRVDPQNNWDFADDEKGERVFDYDDNSEQEVSQQEISAGRGLVREKLKSIKRKNLGPQFDQHTGEQLQIPGV